MTRLLLVAALVVAPLLRAHAREAVTVPLARRDAYRTAAHDIAAASPTAMAIRSRHRGLEFSTGLADIATALAAVFDRPISSGLDRQMQHRAGVPNPGLMVVSVSTTEGGDTDLLDTIDRIVSDHPEITHLGWGRAPHRRADGRWQHFVVGQTRRASLTAPIPSTVSRGAAIPLRFRLEPHHHDPSVLVQEDQRPPQRITPSDEGNGHWMTVVPVPDTARTLSLQVVATSSAGPAPVLTMTVDVDPDPDDRDGEFAVAVATDFDAIENAQQAAERTTVLINKARTDHGLQALSLDPDLAAVALAHSQDMVINRFLAHRSPVTGGLTERLEAAGLSTLLAVENLARDPSIDDAHQQLMASPGHRANILHPEVTHVGVGAVREFYDGGPPHWVVTVVMTRPFTPLSGPRAEAVLLELLDRRRTDAGLPLLARTTMLDATAAELSRNLAADGGWQDEAFELAQQWLEAQGVRWKRLRAHLVVGRESGELEDFDGGLDPDLQEVGISARVIRGAAGAPYVVACLVFMES